MLRLYNTLTKEIEEFIPLKEGEVNMYVCGITPYDEPHLGHARCYITFDILRRYLEYKGYKVRYIQNITDIDDKIIDRAKELKEEPSSLSERYINEYLKYMELLNVRSASFYPRVSNYIREIIKVISSLIDNGYAYQVDQDVYFDVKRFPYYGRLSGRCQSGRLPGARIEIDPRKKDPTDFALWKGAKEGEPSWESPWGRGRPGWHIECSVISMEYLGERFDIHGGGIDLVFPHHENEIAQSYAYTGKIPARYWIHNGFVMKEGEKMSKSIGNVLNLKDILARYSPEVVRLFLLKTHYRNPINFTFEGLDQAKAGLERFYNTIDNIKWELKNKEGMIKDHPEIKDVRSAFEEAMDDDLNTSKALAVLYDLAGRMNSLVAKREKTEEDLMILRSNLGIFRELSSLLGLFKEALLYKYKDEMIEDLIKEREGARLVKDWKRADYIRERLNSLGIILEDTHCGTRWKYK